MRAIILIQSIIIVLGAYYIYSISPATAVQPSLVPIVQIVPVAPTTTHAGYVAPKTQPPKDDTIIHASSSGITGPSDAGMEYPTNPDTTYPNQPLR